MRSSSWPVLIALARASSGVASATSVPKAWNQSCVKVVGSPTIRSEACVPRLSSSPIVPKSAAAAAASSVVRASGGRGSSSA